ncbi:copper chaperone PCu(A)C [Leucobacter triazinivorans]|uniref:Copper chaperone PCu(A)C n=1 Tax=Leucobacter triazinivorans TaxID=1784719 RepID=A0A4P6KCJ6_9MICO|nr:copper chaperone PCu(A)C [Leucobacter triazinivorans]QBE47843.1 copper chaperone PCu(A)C [Leucobacter triazinivorans]
MNRSTTPTTRPVAGAAARRRGALAAALAASLLLAGCSSPAGSGTAEAGAAVAPSADAAHGEPIALTDGWAKAGSGMTGVFGVLENRGDSEITLESVDSPAAGMVELHETVTSGAEATMREVEDGFAIPAGGSVVLEPGGNHIMFMDLAEPLLAGDEVPLVLHFDDGSTLEVTVLVKDFAGAQENYEGSDAHDDAGHDDAGHDDHAHDADHAEH